MPDPADVRATYLRFPGWTQNFWTWATGKALPHQEPLIRHTWASYLALTLAGFFGGLALSAWAVSARPARWEAALAVGWVLTLWAARTMILVIAHQCIHRRFSGSRAIDRFVGELVTVLNVYQDARTFKTEHFDGHHREAVFATREDPPVQVLIGLGFRPGMSRAALWLRAVTVFFSPVFYLRGFGDRLHCNLVTGTWRRAGFAAWAAFWLALPFWLPHGSAVLLLAFGVPVVLLSQLSALLDKLGEHAWLADREPAARRGDHHAAATWARFCGAPVPQPGETAAAAAGSWAAWTLTMLFYHLPCRILVVVGDLPNHDFHHRHPASPDWMIAAYARQRDIDAGARPGPPYDEIWGLGRAIDRMFQGMSRVRPEGRLHASLDR